LLEKIRGGGVRSLVGETVGLLENLERLGVKAGGSQNAGKEEFHG
jgi:hypothetical protein